MLKKMLSRWELTLSLVAATLSAILCTIGGEVYLNASINGFFGTKMALVKTVFRFLAEFVLFFILFSGIVLWKKREEKQEEPLRVNKWLPYLVFMLFFAEYLLVLAAYYPGMFAYDMIVQTNQALGFLPIDRFQPALHTAIWKLCLSVGKVLSPGEKYGISAAITIYGLLQSAFYAFVLSRTALQLRHALHGKKAVIWTVIFYALNPVIVLFSVNPTKDVLFGCALLMFYARYWRILEKNNETLSIWELFWLGADLFFCCMFRNNAVYAFLLTIPLVFFWGRGLRKKLMIVFSLASLVYFIVNGPVLSALHVQGGDMREALSVPFQQLAHAYNSEHESMSERELELYGKFFKVERLNGDFNPRFADPVKAGVNGQNLKKDFKDFLWLYFDILKKHPDNYVNEFLTLTVSSWYPGATGVDAIAKREYVETRICDYLPEQPVRKSRCPALLRILEKMADFSMFDGIPVVRNLLSMAMPIWVIMICFFIFLVGRNARGCLLCGPVFLIWATYLAGPVVAMRYYFPFLLILPVLIAAQMGRIKAKEN